MPSCFPACLPNLEARGGLINYVVNLYPQGVKAAGQYSALLQYPLHPSSLQQLQKLELSSSWAGAWAPMLRSCAAILAASGQDAIQDAALVHAAEAARPSIAQTSFLRHGNTAVSSPLRDSCIRRSTCIPVQTPVPYWVMGQQMAPAHPCHSP